MKSLHYNPCREEAYAAPNNEYFTASVIEFNHKPSLCNTDKKEGSNSTSHHVFPATCVLSYQTKDEDLGRTSYSCFRNRLRTDIFEGSRLDFVIS